ncbi:hypothetical protein FKM82_018941 [Ascaphus truei]
MPRNQSSSCGTYQDPIQGLKIEHRKQPDVSQTPQGNSGKPESHARCLCRDCFNVTPNATGVARGIALTPSLPADIAGQLTGKSSRGFLLKIMITL